MKALALFFSFLFLSAALADSRSNIAIEGKGFFKDPNRPVDQFEGFARAEYENRLDLSEAWFLKVHPYFQATTLPQAWTQPYIADPRELYIGAEKYGLFAHAGFFTLSYEGTDGINPMDIASMKNWGDPLHSISKASYGMHVGYTGNKFEFEVAYMPDQTISASSIPGETSAWYPRSTRFPIRSDKIELLLPDRVDYVLLNDENINHAFLHNYTARAQLHTDYGDAAAAYFEGVADWPLIFPTIDVVPIAVSPKEIYLLQSPVKIAPRYYRRRTVAGLLTVPVGQFILRVASRYDQPLMQAKRFTTWSGQSVAGVERSFTISEQMVTFILQGSIVKKPRTASLISIQDLFDEALLLGVRWPLNDFWTVQVSGLRSGADQSQLYGAELTRTFASQWTAKATVQVLEGPPQSVLGVYDDNDRVGLEISRAF